MARIGQERARVGQHTDKAAEHADVRKALELRGHAVVMVVEPPSWAELDLARGGRILEAPRHRGQFIVVRRVERVQDGLGQLIADPKQSNYAVSEAAEITSAIASPPST